MTKKLLLSDRSSNLTNNSTQIKLVKAALRVARKWKIIRMKIKACELRNLNCQRNRLMNQKPLMSKKSQP